LQEVLFKEEIMLKLSLSQIEVKDDLEINLKKIKDFIQISKGDLVIFPELALTGYKFRFSSFSQEIIDSALQEIQKLTHIYKKSVLIGAPFYENNQIYNAAYFISSQKIEVVAEKFLLFPEIDKNFTPGKKRKLIEINGFKLGVIICFELRSPEIIRNLIKEGMDILVVAAQWPEARINHWESLLKARAIENQIFVVGINAISEIDNIKILGKSLAFSPLGNPLSEVSEEEKIIEVSIPKEKDKIPYPLRTPYLEFFEKVKSIEELKELIKKRREKGQIMVFTNGCFDILHVGHIHYLSSARSLGDFLVVGLNSDESVKKIKGSLRPINSEKERAYALSALECVDYIVFFDEETPEKLIKELKPDILVKGADWEEEKIVGATFVKSYGGKVERIPFKFDVSTTKIIEKILKIYKI
jgi:rfaE bifunctional protein nucleotidyltransferase chain/domain